MADDEYKEAFQLFDKDGDGKISSSELGTVMRAVGQNPTQAEVREYISNDLGGKDQFTLDDFLKVLKNRSKPSNQEDQIKEAFKVFDKSNSGLIEINELKHVLTTLGEKLSAEEVDGVLKEADQDGDGKISLNDFLRVMKSAKA